MGPHTRQDGARKDAAGARPADAPALAAIGLEAEFGLVVETAPGAGTTVTGRLPVRILEPVG